MDVDKYNVLLDDSKWYWDDNKWHWDDNKWYWKDTVNFIFENGELFEKLQSINKKRNKKCVTVVDTHTGGADAENDNKALFVDNALVYANLKMGQKAN